MLYHLASLNEVQYYIPLQLSEFTDKDHRAPPRKSSEYKTKEETLNWKTVINMGIPEWKLSHNKTEDYVKIKSYEKASSKRCITPPNSPSWQTNSPAVDQEIPHTLWNWELQYHAQPAICP